MSDKCILDAANLKFEVEQWREFLLETKAQVIRLQEKLNKAEEEYHTVSHRSASQAD